VTLAIDPVQLAADLIACRSITPARGEVFDVLEQALAGIGFDVHRFFVGERRTGPWRICSPRGGAEARISALPGTSMWCRPAKAGRVTRSNPTCAAAFFTVAAQWT
jgi:hypothetical protein